MAISPNKENYLKTIFELHSDQKKITNKNIADILNVRSPSVTEMLTNLDRDGLVTHSPHKEISLTEAGLELATQMVKKHRLWEVFLNQDLGYGIEEVHQAADALEHATDQQLEERLNKFLDYPTKCPHGGVIPENAKPEIDDEVMTLANAEIGQEVEIIRILDNHEFLMYFGELDLNLGDKITVLRHLPFDGPIEVKTKNHQVLAISLKAANYIFVK